MEDAETYSFWKSCNFTSSLSFNDFTWLVKYALHHRNINEKHNADRKHKNTERRKTSFPKEKVENADLYKIVANKIMTINMNTV